MLFLCVVFSIDIFIGILIFVFLLFLFINVIEIFFVFVFGVVVVEVENLFDFFGGNNWEEFRYESINLLGLMIFFEVFKEMFEMKLGLCWGV